MKHSIFSLLIACVLASCGSTRKVESYQNTVRLDSVCIRDSIIFKDSLVTIYEWKMIDSVCIHDSTVLVLDNNGNILRQERYRLIKRERNTNKNVANTQKQQTTNMSKKSTQHYDAKHINSIETIFKKSRCMLITWSTLILICFVIWYYKK